MLKSRGSKKNCRLLSHNERKNLIEPNNNQLSISKQSELLGISRSSFYYQQVPISDKDKHIMDLIDEIYTKCPFYGSRRINQELKQKHQIDIGRKHTRTLMKNMGLEAIYPRKNKVLSKLDKQHKIYPYLLKNYALSIPNQVWSTDITYIKLTNGFCYLIAIIDWFSRYVINWKLSNTLEIDFCLNCLNDAVDNQYGCKPKIFNTDQGGHFTSNQFTDILKSNKILISMDGRGRCLDNIFVERLWRSVKYENIYIKDYQSILEVRDGLTEYFNFYNNERFHQSLNYQTPANVHFAKQ